LAPPLATIRTVEVEQFCSWSAWRRGNILVVGFREHHVEEILHVAEVLPWVNERQALAHPVGCGGNGADLGNQQGGGIIKKFEVLFPVIAGHFRIVASEGIEHGAEDRHGVGLGRKALEVVLEINVQPGPLSHFGPEGVQFLLVRELSVNDQIG
jgi:hypothetical protein